MKPNLLRRLAAAALLLLSAALSSCEDDGSGGGSGGVGFSVGLPTSYGSMELGMATTSWSSGPFWH